MEGRKSIIDQYLSDLKCEEDKNCLYLENLKTELDIIASEKKRKLLVFKKIEELIMKNESVIKDLMVKYADYSKKSCFLQDKIHLVALENKALTEQLEELKKKKNDLSKEKLCHKDNKYRKKLVACKLLTSIHFDHSIPISGYVLHQDLSCTCFELKNVENQKKITDYLWKSIM